MRLDERGKLCPIPVVEAKKALEAAGAGQVVEVVVDNEIAVQNLKKMADHRGLKSKYEKISDREFLVEIEAAGNKGGAQAAGSGSAAKQAAGSGSAAKPGKQAEGSGSAGKLGKQSAESVSAAKPGKQAAKSGAAKPGKQAAKSGSAAKPGKQTAESGAAEAPGARTDGEETAACLPDSRRKGMVVVLASGRMGQGDKTLGALLMKGFVYALAQQDVLPETVLLYNGGAKLSCEGSDALEDLKSLEAQGTEVLTCGTCLNHYGLADKLAVGGVTNMYEIAERMTGADLLVRP